MKMKTLMRRVRKGKMMKMTTTSEHANLVSLSKFVLQYQISLQDNQSQN